MDRESGVKVNINSPRRVAVKPVGGATTGAAATRAEMRSAAQRVASGTQARAQRVATSPQGSPEPQMPRVVAPSESRDADSQPAGKKHRRPLSKFRKISIAVLVIGMLAIASGGGFLAYKLLTQQEVSDDAAYLVEVGKWQRENEPSVVWDFTDAATSDAAGKGSLTTNDHVNDYDFAWAIDGDQLAINTDWLYEMNDDFTYTLDQQAQKLTLARDGETWNFVPAASK